MRWSLVMGTLVSACGVNPAFNPYDVTGESSSSSSGSTPASASAPTGSGDESTGTSTGAVAASTAVDTSGAATTGGVGETSDGSSSTGASSDTGPTGPCWDQGVGTWAPGVAVTELTGAGADSGTLLPDGLTMVYVAGDPRRLHRAVRADRGVAFMGGEKLTEWLNIPTFLPDHPAVAFAGAELLYHYDQSGVQGMNLQYSYTTPNDSPDAYSQPSPVLGLSPSGVADEIPAVTADGAVLLVQRNDGQEIPGLGPSWQFHQFVRINPQPGGIWGFGGIYTPYNPPLQLALCPAMSPDGLHLLYTSTAAMTLDEGSVNDETGVWSTQRANPFAPWDFPVPVPGLAEDGGVTCPRALTADGCTLLYTRFVYPDNTPLGMFMTDRW